MCKNNRQAGEVSQFLQESAGGFEVAGVCGIVGVCKAAGGCKTVGGKEKRKSNLG